MNTPPPNPRQIADDIGRDANVLVSLLTDAASVQFLPSRRLRDAGDTGIRSKGVHSDPTGETALDPVRLALRAEVKAAARALVQSHDELYRRRMRLETALERWKGDPPSGV